MTSATLSWCSLAHHWLPHLALGWPDPDVKLSLNKLSNWALVAGKLQKHKNKNRETLKGRGPHQMFNQWSVKVWEFLLRQQTSYRVNPPPIPKWRAIPCWVLTEGPRVTDQSPKRNQSSGSGAQWPVREQLSFRVKATTPLSDNKHIARKICKFAYSNSHHQ